MATVVVVAAVVLTVVVIAVLLKQGSVGRLSEEAGHPPRDAVVERPAGPDAEAMHPDPPGRRPGGTQPPEDGPRR